MGCPWVLWEVVGCGCHGLRDGGIGWRCMLLCGWILSREVYCGVWWQGVGVSGCDH